MILFGRATAVVKTEKPDSALSQNPAAPKMTLTVEEMAEEMHISRPVAYELVREPAFPSFRIGKRILVNRNGLQRWIDDLSGQPLSENAEKAL